MVAVFVYALIDTFFLNSFAYAVTPYWLLFAGVGAAFSAIAFLATRAAPLTEQLAVSALLGLMVTFASYPLASRIDRWTDPDGPQSVTYVHDGQGRFTAEDQPILDFSESLDAWPLAAGEAHVFEISRGILGLDQVNLGRVRKELQDGRVRLKALPAP